MRLKELPVTLVRLPNLQLEGGPSKRPPCELVALRVEDPVGLEPVEDVVVAGEENDFAGGASPRLGESERAELRDLPVNDRGELVDNRLCRSLADEPREVRPEPLTVRQSVVRPKPGR